MASKPKQKEQPEKGEETRYYQRIIVMLMNLGTDTLLKLFKSLIPQGDVSLFLDSMFNEVEKLKTSKKISAAEYNRISKRPLVGTELDIAILIKLMLELLPKKLQQVSSKLLPFTADLQRLRRIRNELIGHRPAATITKKEFDYYWEMISIILKRILPKDQSKEELDKRMENCKTGTVSDADVQKILEKFAKLSSLITQAEALGEKKKEFQLFFKRPPEKYVRYVKLLFDGGKHVLLGVLYREMNKDNATFDRLIRTNLDKLPGIIKEILLPSTSIEPSSLDISELAEVILNLFGDRISQKDNKHIQTIKDARINYADLARLSLDESKFLSVWTRLVSSISILSTDIDKSLNDKCMEMIEKCTDETLDVTSVDEYLDQLQLETGCVKIKKLKEVYEDMLSKLKSLLEEMIDENLFFKEPKELELLVNIDCNNPEIKRMVEENLQADIQTAVQTISIGGVNEQPNEIESLIQNFTANEDVTITKVSRKCILIVLQFSTCGAMKNVIQFVKSAAFQFHTEHVSRMLCLEYGEPISIQANLTLESINNLNNQITQPGDDGHAETHGVKISIGCSSVTGVRHVSEVLKQEKITNTLNELAGTLSDRFGETIALRSVPDFKEWNDIFNDKDFVTDDSSTSNEDDSSEDRFDKKPKESTDEQVMKRFRTDDSAIKEQSEYEKSKLDLQTRLIEFYREDILHVSALPQQQEGNLCDFKDVYVRPRMTIASKDELDTGDVLLMSQIFIKDDKPTKSVYVLGEAGSGKSTFCKSLVSYWCLAHSDEEQSTEDMSDWVEEMKKFIFLFFLPLRHYTDKLKIKEMLEETYEHPALMKILDCESRTCLIVLDGLDEWTSQASQCPPERDSLKECTVITTSRPWKIATLGISDNEIRQKIILQGFDYKTNLKKMIEKTVPILNKMFGKDKVPSNCEKALKKKSVASLKHTAIMLQQLICLWFDDKLCVGTSRCALYTELLNLFFDWHKKKHPDDPLFTEMMTKSEYLKNVDLPLYLIGSEVCKSYSYIIHGVSRLAYETLFNNTKETSLSFDSSTFERLKISNEVKSSCLKLGILSEEKSLSLSASKSRRSIILFVHKSFQEYLAAVYIAIRFGEHTAPSADSVNTDLSGHCANLIRDFFSKCTTLDEILEQENVLMMLCGLAPRIATYISEYIYEVVTKDKRILEYRRTIDDRHIDLISNIQGCIINCLEEVQACQFCTQPRFYLGDITSRHLSKSAEKDFFSPDSVISFIDLLEPDSVMSFRTDEYKVDKYLKRALKYLPKCQRLEAIHINDNDNDKIDEECIKSVCDAIEGNTSTLKVLYVYGVKLICRTIVRCLPDISHLVALKIKSLTMPHEDFTSLCTFLSGNSHLEQISISLIDCETFGDSSVCRSQHEVDLSKHQQLQYLEYDKSVTVTRVNTSNLEKFLYRPMNSTNFVKVFDNISTAYKLTKLELWNDIVDSVKNPSHHTVTDKLITLLPLLHQLCKLTLGWFIFTDNIMKCPSEMKSMKFIELIEVRMSLTTWRNFVNSLPQIPLPVKVRAKGMSITRDGDKCNPDKGWLRGEKGGEEAAAWQYVREQKAFCNVKHGYADSIKFSTRKLYPSAVNN